MYEFQSRVRYSEIDPDGEGGMSLTGIINYLQDCSTFQSEAVGLGLDYLSGRHQAWWLSSWQIIIDRYPKLGDEIRIGTWPYEFNGMYGYRNFYIRDMAGEYMVRANSIWFMFDTAAKRPVRAGEDQIRGYGPLEERIPMDYAPRRIALPAEYEEGSPVTVARHHIDTNHHVNNAQYVQIAQEYLPEGIRIAELRVEYKKAAYLGDVMIPRISRIPEGYVIALCDSAGSPHAIVWVRERQGRLSQPPEVL